MPAVLTFLIFFIKYLLFPALAVLALYATGSLLLAAFSGIWLARLG